MNAEIEKEIIKCVQALRDGGFIIFPSEIGWSIGCDAAAEENVIAIIDSENNHYPAILLEAPGRISKYVREIPDAAWDLIEYSTKPLHLAIEEIINFPSQAFKNFEEIVFRVVKDEFTTAMINKFGKPVFAATFLSTDQPAKINTTMNKNCYVVNLRLGAKANPQNLVVMRFLKGGRFEIIKK